MPTPLRTKSVVLALLGAAIIAGGLFFSKPVSFQNSVDVQSDIDLQGYVSSTAVVKEAHAHFNSVSTTQTLCSIQNTGAQDRVLTYVTLAYATDTVTGGAAQRFTISLSGTQSATGTGADLLHDNSPAVPTNGILNLTTTSTLQTGSVVWRKNIWLNYLIASPTTTFTGDCAAAFL